MVTIMASRDAVLQIVDNPVHNIAINLKHVRLVFQKTSARLQKNATLLCWRIRVVETRVEESRFYGDPHLSNFCE